MAAARERFEIVKEHLSEKLLIAKDKVHGLQDNLKHNEKVEEFLEKSKKRKAELSKRIVNAAQKNAAYQALGRFRRRAKDVLLAPLSIERSSPKIT